MITPIQKNTPQEPYDTLWVEEQEERCSVSLRNSVKPPEAILSIGTHTYKGEMQNTIVMSKGSISIISAPSKSKKSFFKSQLCASYIGGNATHYFPSIKSHRKAQEAILDFDTEQSAYYAQRTFRRVEEIVGGAYPLYFPFQIVELSAEERVFFIEKMIQKHQKNIGLVCIDGVADLLNDVNNLEQSTALANTLLRWANTYNIHICAVIHNAYGNTKPTGHLGSAVVKKAESVFSLLPDANDFNIITVHHQYARGRPFDDFRFTLNENNALIYELSLNEEFAGEIHTTTEQPTTETTENLKKVQPKDAFGTNEIPF